MNMNDVDLQTSLSAKSSGNVRPPQSSKSKLLIAGAVLAILALIPLFFGVVNWAMQPAGDVDQTVSQDKAPFSKVESAEAPAAAVAPAEAPAPAPDVRTIYVAGAGGQSMVDACIGPIHYTPTNAYATFITEHDFCGGWGRFSGISVGETVSIPGYGTFTATGRGQVPNPGSTNDVAAVFGGFPAVVLQTCIPGTSQMLVIALN
ncbi:hypothetical protein [Arthrobacter sp. 31Y]|uniref:hypothetical protein n=1 Tax=Arthrobacter sp. 31Y TaxID=1115632 RepID=UPI0004676CF1|nr:hypothetical protein [Arthrobacter sp. 31Y]